MYFELFAHDANPAIDRRIGKLSSARAQEKLDNKEAVQIGERSLQLVAVRTNARVSEHRGSPESSGCLTAQESELNSDYRGKQTQILWLSREYEDRLEQHVAAGRRGTPKSCAVIAARVKTILTKPTLCPA